MSEKFAVGSFCWNEMLTTDVPQARAFYADLFGWTPVETEMGPPDNRYVLFMNNGEHVGGLGSLELGDLGKGKGNATSRWMPHVNVTDLASTLAKALELGGKQLSGPSAIPGVGQYAVIEDPTGAQVALFQGGTA